MSECCNECVFYKEPRHKQTCGTCDYPVPEWMKIGVLGGSFITQPEYSGTDCATFKSRADVVGDSKIIEPPKTNKRD